MPARQATSTKSKRGNEDRVFSEAERAAVAATARERKAGGDGLQDLRDSIARMPADDRAMAERIHAIVSAAAPALEPKTYYGMPAYATEGKNGKVILWFKPKSKFRVRYSTIGFGVDARLDDGDLWATEFAVINLTPAVESKIAELVRKAAG